MGGAFARDVLLALVPQSRHIDAAQEVLAGAQQDGPDGEMQLVDQGGLQTLPNRGDAATEADVATARCRGRLGQGGVDAFGDEVKLRASCHLSGARG